jgi:ABC-2 type transport system permease protein
MECNMRREGSALRGVGVVMLKELADHFTSILIVVMVVLVVLIAMVTVWLATETIKDTTAEDPFLFLRLFTTSREPLPSFVAFLSFLVPLIAICLGFDAINGEHNRRTLSRIMAQPIYRDALLFGKFAAGLVTLAISLTVLWALLIGFGLVRLGVAPNAEEISRALIFLMVSIAYAGVWLALALLASIVFRSPATAALITLGLWLFLTLIWPAIWSALGPTVVVAFAPNANEETVILSTQYLSRVSPSIMFGEVVLAVLNPATRSLGPIYLSQLQGAVVGAPLPLTESLVIAWPQIVGLIAGTILLFVVGYVVFQRQEVRA